MGPKEIAIALRKTLPPSLADASLSVSMSAHDYANEAANFTMYSVIVTLRGKIIAQSSSGFTAEETVRALLLQLSVYLAKQKAVAAGQGAA